MSATSETQFEFKAEVQRVLALVINSLYTNPEVFLRELISNASDALDKARYLRLTEGDEVVEADGEPKIVISLDDEKNVLVVEDNGVGMTRDEVVENLGTIARSGTSEFAKRLEELTKRKDEDGAVDLIGQFGVGFYAVFMVASRVDVETRSIRRGAEPVLWRSSGEGSYNVLPGERDALGTRITIHLKTDASEFAQKWRVESIVKKYSDFVMFPIEVDGEVKNQSAALWRKPKSQVTDEDHAAFFKHVTQGRGGDNPRATIHYSVDAPVQFSALLYVPERAPADLFTMNKEREGLRLYAKRVLIQEHCDKLLPVYLRFVRGVVDSEDLQLNVSRETLQENRTLKTIENQLTKQVLKELTRLGDEEPEQYLELYRAFGQVLKEGLTLDFKQKDTLAGLCRFETLRGKPGELVSLSAYVAAKGGDQKAIYYVTGQSRAQLEQSPHLEVFRKREIDVLLLTDPIDEWVVKALPTFEELPLTSVVHGELDFEGDDEEFEEKKNALGVTVAEIRRALGDKVTEVRVSSRLTDTASCLVAKEGDPGANMERIMRMLDEGARERSRVLEINPNHPFVQNLRALVEKTKGSPKVDVYSEMLYEQALLSEGVIEDPARLVKRLDTLLVESSEAALRD
ncbi:MAG: molecular chaperone HtpG [Myxococcota bacterium]